MAVEHSTKIALQVTSDKHILESQSNSVFENDTCFAVLKTGNWKNERKI